MKYFYPEKGHRRLCDYLARVHETFFLLDLHNKPGQIQLFPFHGERNRDPERFKCLVKVIEPGETEPRPEFRFLTPIPEWPCHSKWEGMA